MELVDRAPLRVLLHPADDLAVRVELAMHHIAVRNDPEQRLAPSRLALKPVRDVDRLARAVGAVPLADVRDARAVAKVEVVLNRPEVHIPSPLGVPYLDQRFGCPR